MSNIDEFISLPEASTILNVSADRIAWLIAIGELSSTRSQERKSKKLISLQDVYRLRGSPLLARWFIYALIDPRDNAVRYVGQTNEPSNRFSQHITAKPEINLAKHQWIQELIAQGLEPRFEILECINVSPAVVDEREFYWIQHFQANNIKLTNLALQPRTNCTSPTFTKRSIDSDGVEWVPLVEAASHLGVEISKLSRLASKGKIQTQKNPLDERVRLVNFDEVRTLFETFKYTRK
jgi:hypothetical protein